jgi:hypothetical protein
MNTQPNALRLAAQLEDPVNAKLYLAPYIATELRQLHAVNQDLLQALQAIMVGIAGCQREPEWEAARAAIAKATGEVV